MEETQKRMEDVYTVKEDRERSEEGGPQGVSIFCFSKGHTRLIV